MTGATPQRQLRESFCKQRGEDNHPRKRGFRVTLPCRAGFFHVGGRQSNQVGQLPARQQLDDALDMNDNGFGRSRRDMGPAQLPLRLASVAARA